MNISGLYYRAEPQTYFVPIDRLNIYDIYETNLITVLKINLLLPYIQTCLYLRRLCKKYLWRKSIKDLFQKDNKTQAELVEIFFLWIMKNFASNATAASFPEHFIIDNKHKTIDLFIFSNTFTFLCRYLLSCEYIRDYVIMKFLQRQIGIQSSELTMYLER